MGDNTSESILAEDGCSSAILNSDLKLLSRVDRLP
jgi:hypothetical protein